MSDLTHLEAAILKAMGDQNPVLGAVLATARVTTRENTGHGFFTKITTSRTAPLPPMKARQMNGPDAHMIDMGEGMLMGSILWFENGYPDCLEGFQYGDGDGRTIDLTLRDLKSLRFSKLVPPV